MEVEFLALNSHVFAIVPNLFEPVRIAVLPLLVILLVGCAHQPSEVATVTPAMPMPEVQVDQENNYWWYARFRMEWEEGEKRPDFSKNLIVAREVIAPVLARHSEKIKLWRFHRRAARDATGHQFSFIFYSTPEDARKVYARIRSSKVVNDLLESGDLLTLKFDDTARPSRASIAGTSDPNWPESIQKSWPYFIMGVSLMWLDLVEQAVDPDKLGSRSGISRRLDYYRKIHQDITALWKQVGRHALFHHINAIYAYEPLEIVF